MTSSPVFGKADHGKPQAYVFEAAQALMGQTEERGALPLLYASVAADVAGGAYIGPAWAGPVPLNLMNTGQHEPASHEVKDAAACSRLYDAVINILHEHAGNTS